LIHARIPPETLASRDADAFVPRPEFAQAVSLGFDAILADFYWLQAVQVVGGADDNPESYGTHLGRLIDVVTTLNPYVDHPYRFAAIWLQDSREQVETANRLLRRSLDYHPWEWRNRFYLGYNLFYYLGENEAAAEMLEAAAQISGSPRYLPRLVARLKSESGDIDTAELFLRQLVKDAPDPASRAEYQSALDEIEVEHRARRLDRAREVHRKLTGREIESVGELAAGEHSVLDRLPAPWPSSLPESFRGKHAWVVPEDEGPIFSSYYGHRYELSFHPVERERIQAWGADSDQSAEGSERASETEMEGS